MKCGYELPETKSVYIWNKNFSRVRKNVWNSEIEMDEKTTQRLCYFCQSPGPEFQESRREEKTQKCSQIWICNNCRGLCPFCPITFWLFFISQRKTILPRLGIAVRMMITMSFATRRTRIWTRVTFNCWKKLINSDTGWRAFGKSYD